jgi:DNA-binding transcriptional LysR family regulator
MALPCPATQRAGTVQTIPPAVAAGAGVSVLPCFLADPDPTFERIVPKPVLSHALWLVIHPDLRATARVRVVYDFLGELVRTEAPTLRGDRADVRGPSSAALTRKRPNA